MRNAGPLDVDEGVEGRCRVGLRASCMLYNLATYRIGAVTEKSSHSIGRGLLSVAVTGVEPERPGARSRPWFFITSHYRKLETRTKRTSPSEIGRASCRERVESGGVAVAW